MSTPLTLDFSNSLKGFKCLDHSLSRGVVRPKVYGPVRRDGETGPTEITPVDVPPRPPVRQIPPVTVHRPGSLRESVSVKDFTSGDRKDPLRFYSIREKRADVRPGTP